MIKMQQDAVNQIIGFNRNVSVNNATTVSTTPSISSISAYLTVAQGTYGPTPTTTSALFFPNSPYTTNLHVISNAQKNLVFASFQFISTIPSSDTGTVSFTICRYTSPMSGAALGSAINLATNTNADIVGQGTALYVTSYNATTTSQTGTCEFQLIDDVQRYNGGDYYYAIRVVSTDTTISYKCIKLSSIQLV